MSVLISVIVPVYKAEKYLCNCIESILTQTFCDFELILIDDGSPDNSGEICDAYAKKDSRVNVIHNENGGVTKARATGVDAVTCSEFITFVDADDTLPRDALYNLYMGNWKDHDIIIGNYNSSTTKYTENVIPYDEYTKMVLAGKVHSAPWGRLFRRRLFNDETFNLSRDFVVGEDLIMNLRISFENRLSVRFISQIVYNYNNVPTGTMNSFKITEGYIGQLYIMEKKIIPLPLHNLYMPFCIEGILTYKNQIIEHYFQHNEWEETEFHAILMNDINNFHFRQTGYLKWVLRFSNPFLGFLHYFFRRLIDLYRFT